MTEAQEIPINPAGTAGSPVDLSGMKICIAFPSPDLIDVGFHHCLMQLITETSRFVNLGLTNAASSRIAKNRNTIVKNARQLAATHILYIDSDSTFPVHALMTLLMHNKDIVCATTCRRKGTSREPIAVPVDMNEAVKGPRLLRMRQIGLPFMLIKMSVFDKLDELGMAPDGTYFAEPARWMFNKHMWPLTGDDELLGEDEYFCEIVQKAGYDIWCDMSLSMEIGHIGSQVFYIQQPENPNGIAAKVDEVL